MSTDDLLNRFLRYVKVDTTSKEESDTYPSTENQLDLARMLRDELEALGLRDVGLNEFGIVTGTVPATKEGAPAIAWFAHMDTSPEASGTGVKPVVRRDYDGGDIVLSGNPSQVIRVADVPELAGMKGKTLITSDGTTLLGADDKAGVAIIMSAAADLMADRAIPHGPIRVVFTCDEEVGRGTDKIDLKEIDARVGYTVDGSELGSIEQETFSADMATVTIRGNNIHPGLAKGKMINAVRLAGQFLSRLPWRILAPESTEGREPFLHPYVIEGGVAEVKIKVLLRSFDTADLAEQAEILRRAAATVVAEHPGASIDVSVKKQYRNMIEALRKEPRAVDLAVRAAKNAGVEPRYELIRGGTDGSRLSEKGLPTPNLWAGMYNYHSEREFACLEEMDASRRMLVELARLWGMEK